MHTSRLYDESAPHVAADLDEGHSLTVEDRLADLGLTEAQIAEAVGIVEGEIERVAMHQTAQVIRRIFLHLAGCSTQTAALARALGFGEQSLDELSAKLGCSKQGIGNMIAAVQPFLGPLSERHRAEAELPPAPNNEVWLSMPQARRLTGIHAQALGAAIRSGDLHWCQMRKRFFLEETALLAWQAARDVAAANDRLTNTPVARWKQQQSLKSSASREPLICSA